MLSYLNIETIQCDNSQYWKPIPYLAENYAA